MTVLEWRSSVRVCVCVNMVSKDVKGICLGKGSALDCFLCDWKLNSVLIHHSGVCFLFRSFVVFHGFVELVWDHLRLQSILVHGYNCEV